MATENASRDGNSIPTLLGVSSTDGSTPVKVYADPISHRLLVETTSGGVIGPVSSTDNAIVRFNGITGESIQNSLVTIDDSGNVNAVSYHAGGTSPVADGTYTVGFGTPVTGTNGTITVKGGIITAIQQAT